MITEWALIDNANICIRVDVASQEWVDEWNVEHSDDEERYVIATPDGIGKASPGWVLDGDTQRFIPPDPEIEGVVFDRELWAWIDPNNPPSDGLEEGNSEGT